MHNRPPLWNGIEVPYGLSVDELIHLCDGPEPLRWAAFVALAHEPAEAALLALLRRAESTDPYTKRMALECIGARGNTVRAADTVCRLLSDRNGSVVRTACDVVARWKLLQSHDSVLHLLDAEDPSTREAALRAIHAVWRESAFEAVVHVFKTDTSASVRKQAAWTLHSVASIDNWNRLFGLWREDTQPRHRQWACELARDFGTASILVELEPLTTDHDGHVRAKAIAAIEQIRSRSGASPG